MLYLPALCNDIGQGSPTPLLQSFAGILCSFFLRVPPQQAMCYGAPMWACSQTRMCTPLAPSQDLTDTSRTLWLLLLSESPVRPVRRSSAAVDAASSGSSEDSGGCLGTGGGKQVFVGLFTLMQRMH